MPKPRPISRTQALWRLIVAIALAVSLPALSGCSQSTGDAQAASDAHGSVAELSSDELPTYEGEPYVEVDGGEPAFTDEEKAQDQSFEDYAPLDDLGRCGADAALVGEETMPTEERGSIGEVKPSGWQIAKYDFVDGAYLYNRCHLIGYQLTGENANERNLITGTRYLNVEGMLPFEDEVADYVEETDNHVLYRVTPVFEGDELVARGVQMEAWSVEDGGAGVRFNVYCFNVQPGVEIDYATGENALAEDGAEAGEGRTGARADDAAVSRPNASTEQADYVLNTNSKRFHRPDCPSVDDIKPKNRQGCKAARSDLVAQGYEPCGRCNP